MRRPAAVERHERVAPAAAAPAALLYAGCAGVACVLLGAAAFLAAALLRPTPLYLAAAAVTPFALAAGFLVASNTQAGLCFIAFAIGPLGIVQAEIAGVTLNLPEVLILMLFAKELFLFVFNTERPHPALPWRSLLLYGAAGLVGIHTGRRLGNNPVAILQDFRQFTEFIVLYLLVLHRVKDKKQAHRIVVCYVLGISLLAVHGIVERFTNFGIPVDQILSDAVVHGGTRSGSFYGATPLGGLLVLSIGGITGLLLAKPGRGLRTVLLVCLALCVTTIVFTKTRASWVALLLALLFLFFSIRKSIPVMASVAVGAVIFAMALGPLVAQRMATLEFSRAEISLLERVDYYKVAWYIFRDYPLRGLGWGCQYDIRTVLKNGRHVPPEPRNYAVKRFSARKNTVHSAYLQLLVKIGLVGLASFLVFIFVWLRHVLRARALSTAQRDDAFYNLFIGVSAALVGYLAHSGLENFFQWPVMAQSFWLFMGVSTAAAYTLVQDARTQPGQAAAEPAPARPQPAEP